MATVINPSEEEMHTLSTEEAEAYFEAMVRQFFDVTADEFLKNKDKFKNSPHYDSVNFLIPLFDASYE